MDFNLEKKKPMNEIPHDADEYKIAKAFAEEVKHELGDFVKSIILFGSSVRKKEPAMEVIHGKDIDVLIIINDLTLVLNDEVTQSYRVIVHNLASKHSKLLHITTMTLTNFWGYVRTGDAIVVNMLRDGIVLEDVGVFEPVQALLNQGKIRPTKEAVWIYYAKAPITLKNSRWHIMQAVIDLYWAVIDVSHAVLMHYGHVPPTPAHVAGLMEETLVKKGMLSQKYADEMRFFYALSKRITHRQLDWISGKEYDDYYKRAEAYVKGVKKVLGEGKK